jgi:hypothetical protein
MPPYGFGVLVLFCLPLILVTALSSTPEISLIEPYLSDRVLIHFDTDANRTYTLQYTDRLGTNGGSASTWSNLYKAPKTVDPNHYIVVDWRTNKARFYRLMVTP